MAVRQNVTDLAAHSARLAEEAALREAIRVMFAQQAETGALSIETVNALSAALPIWKPGEALTKGSIRRCPQSGEAMRCKVNIKALSPTSRTAPKPPSVDAAKWEMVV